MEDTRIGSIHRSPWSDDHAALGMAVFDKQKGHPLAYRSLGIRAGAAFCSDRSSFERRSNGPVDGRLSDQ